MFCITGLLQVCCRVKGIADVTASEAEHIDNEPIKHSAAGCTLC